jgi:hypothetical protein
MINETNIKTINFFSNPVFKALMTITARMWKSLSKMIEYQCREDLKYGIEI